MKAVKQKHSHEFLKWTVATLIFSAAVGIWCYNAGTVNHMRCDRVITVENPKSGVFDSVCQITLKENVSQ